MMEEKNQDYIHERERLGQQIRFILEVDKVKNIFRQISLKIGHSVKKFLESSVQNAGQKMLRKLNFA